MIRRMIRRLLVRWLLPEIETQLGYNRRNPDDLVRSFEFAFREGLNEELQLAAERPPRGDSNA